METLKMHSLDGVQCNIELIGKLFPNAITEVKRNGKVEHAIDFDVLRQELSDSIVEGREERYQFTWPDKKKAMLAANAPITATLRPVVTDSVGKDGTPGGFDSENLYIEGDNLEVLKLLQETYLGKVRMIYIDPPYNTGNDFVYEDDFAQRTEDYMGNSGQYDEEGNRMVTNTESNGRFHTDWLNMIYPRLKLAKDLLAEDGIVVISIDDNEFDNLRKCCDEIFGEANLVNCFIWNCSTAGGIRPKFASKTHEYILTYAKSKNSAETIYAPLSSDAIKMYSQKDARGVYRDKDFAFRNKSTNLNQRYGIKCPDGEVVYPKDGYIYRFIYPKFEETLHEGGVTFKKTKTSPLINSNGEQASWNIYIRKYLGDAMGAPSTLIPKEMMSIYNVGTQTIQDLFDGKRVFENAKPVDVIQYMANMFTKGSECNTILDFMVQLPEKTDEKSEAYKAGYKNICEIGKERIRRAGRKIKEDAGLTAPADLDIGFRCLRLDESNMKPVYYTPEKTQQQDLFSLVDNVKPDRTPEDLLFQVMLDLGVLLSSPIEVKEIAGKKVFNVADGFLLACFDHDVTEETVKAIAQMKPYYAVFRDSSMANDSVATNFDQIFETYSPETVRKVL